MRLSLAEIKYKFSFGVNKGKKGSRDIFPPAINEGKNAIVAAEKRSFGETRPRRNAALKHRGRGETQP